MPMTQMFCPTSWVPWRIPWATGRYYTGINMRFGSASLGSNLNALNFMPFYVPNPTGVTVTTLGVNVTAAVASSNCRLAIYTMDTNGSWPFPYKLMIDAGVVATATTGFKSVSISQVLPQGFYFVAGTFYGGASGITVSGGTFSTYLDDAGAADYQDETDYSWYYTTNFLSGWLTVPYSTGFPQTLAPYATGNASTGQSTTTFPVQNTVRPTFVIGV